MDFTTQEWLTALIVLLIIGIFLDGFRRMRNARRDSLRMSLSMKDKKPFDDNNDSAEEAYGSEFPNGGARSSDKKIDKERIAQVRSHYDFGADMAELIKQGRKSAEKYNERIEPTLNEGAQPLGDKQRQGILEERVTEEAVVDTIAESDAQTAHKARANASPATEHNASHWDNEDDALLMDDAGTPTSYRQPPQESVDGSSKPEQTSLNLDETVPMLMESATESAAFDSESPAKVDATTTDNQSSQLGEMGELDGPIGSSTSESKIKPVGQQIESTNDNSEREGDLDTHSANKPRYKSKYFASEPHEKDSSDLEEVLILHVKAVDNGAFYGSDLLPLLLENGLRYGAMDIFHRHMDEDGEGAILFSMANMLMPGVFDLRTFDSFSTVGVTFFLTLPVAGNKNMVVFEQMLQTAKNIAAVLGGELKDEQRSVMTAQTVEHYRERIRDFARRQQLEKNRS